MESVLDKNIIEIITKKNRLFRLLLVFFGTTLLAFVYNIYLVPNNLVYGGLGGFAIIVSDIFNIHLNTLINIITVFLLILSFIFLGRKHTSYTLVGSLSYTIMINITSYITQYINLNIKSTFISLLLYGTIMGIGFGIVYRCGFNTGGADTVVEFLQKKIKLSMTKLSGIVNGIIIVSGLFVFGFYNTVYALIFLIIMNYVSNVIVLGSLDHKICYIKTNKIDKVAKLIVDDLNVGYTIIDSTEGIGIFKSKIIMCIITSDNLYYFKSKLFEIDPHCFFSSSDCYTVEGGKTNVLLPM